MINSNRLMLTYRIATGITNFVYGDGRYNDFPDKVKEELLCWTGVNKEILYWLKEYEHLDVVQRHIDLFRDEAEEILLGYSAKEISEYCDSDEKIKMVLYLIGNKNEDELEEELVQFVNSLKVAYRLKTR